MGKRKRIILDVPSGFHVSLTIIGVCFLLGVVFGCIFAGIVEGTGGEELADFVFGYLTMAADGEVTADFLSVLWSQLRFPLVCFLLGFTALGVIGLPVLFVIRGFLLSFSAACFCRLFGLMGLAPAFFLFGLSALTWGPALFILGMQGLTAAIRLFRRDFGDLRSPVLYDGTYFARCGLCAGLVALSVALEFFIVPTLLGAAAHLVL